MTSQDQLEKFKIYGEKQKVRLYKIKHFIFDFGGVMIEKTFVIKNVLDIIESDLNISIPRDENSYIRKIRRGLSSGRISTQEFLEKIFEKYYYPFQKNDSALPPKKVNAAYYEELWFDLYSQVTNISSEMAEIIERLHKADYTVSLMSNTHDIHAKSNILRGFYDSFDNVFLSNEIGFIKPDMEKYKYVLKKLDTKPKKCIFIDDKIQNLVPARELGIIVIRFESFEKFKEQLNELGIGDISKDLRHEIKKRYKKYKKTKKEYKKAKKEYKKAKKDYLKKKGKSLKRRMEYQRKRSHYRKKKAEYKKEKVKKKEELESKLRIT
ncbi:MAG: HAD-IA family hydrolase [Promethearchaeota archaeon]|nr:MAG: HAD-IA family hydrolase [Candidatus Lokiarchaeota archaeon]